MTDIAQRLAELKARIAESEFLHQRPKDSVILLAASKGQAVASILTAYEAGVRHFGENYVQEALEKIPKCPDDIIWHFIGPIQSNKTRKIAEHFAWVHSVDDEKIAQRLNDQRPQHLSPLQICLEININAEQSKFGTDADKIKELAAYCRQLPNLNLRGLMTIPAPNQSPETTRQAFHQLAHLQQQLNSSRINLDTLSMGMSDDFELAIAEGATIVRIGTALFGARSR